MNKLLISFFSLFCIIFFIQEENIQFSDRVFFTSILIQILSIYNIFKNENIPYSLNKIFFLFSFFFFGVAPLVQFYKKISMWGMSLKESEYFYMNIIIIAIILCYSLLYNLLYKVDSRNKHFTSNKKSIPEKLSIKQTIFLVALSIISFLVVFTYNDYTIERMLIRGGEILDAFNIEEEESPTLGLIVNNFIRPLSMMCFLFYSLVKRRNKIVLCILALLAIITCFPLGMARFAAAALYIPVLVLLIPIFRRKNVFSLTFISGLLIIFPFLNNFRDLSADAQIEIKPDFEMFTEGHFDSYHNFGLIVSNDIITYGRQLLGVIFFWVPRVYWPDKPIGSGAYLADKINLIFNNVAANFFAEGYINWGLPGILLFVIVLAYITAKLDKLYWTDIIVSEKNNLYTITYVVLLGMLFFILRGDLLSSTAYTCGYLTAIYFVYKSINLINTKVVIK